MSHPAVPLSSFLSAFLQEGLGKKTGSEMCLEDFRDCFVPHILGLLLLHPCHLHTTLCPLRSQVEFVDR